MAFLSHLIPLSVRKLKSKILKLVPAAVTGAVTVLILLFLILLKIFCSDSISKHMD